MRGGVLRVCCTRRVRVRLQLWLRLHALVPLDGRMTVWRWLIGVVWCLRANAMLVGVVNTGALVMFQLFWFLPMYLISFLLSAKWYNDIAREGATRVCVAVCLMSLCCFAPSHVKVSGCDSPMMVIMMIMTAMMVIMMFMNGAAAFKYSYDPRATTESGNGASYFSEIAQQKRAPVKNLVTLLMYVEKSQQHTHTVQHTHTHIDGVCETLAPAALLSMVTRSGLVLM